MQDAKPSLFARDDTFLGVCQGLGEDFGFDPLWLRLVFTFAVFWNPIAAVFAYLAVGVVMVAARFIYPAADAARSDPEAGDDRVAEAGNDEAPAPTALAA